MLICILSVSIEPLKMSCAEVVYALVSLGLEARRFTDSLASDVCLREVKFFLHHQYCLYQSHCGNDRISEPHLGDIRHFYAIVFMHKHPNQTKHLNTRTLRIYIHQIKAFYSLNAKVYIQWELDLSFAKTALGK